MAAIRNDSGSVALEFVLLTAFLGVAIWLAGEQFIFFRASALARAAGKTAMDTGLRAAGWPVCLEEMFEPINGQKVMIAGRHEVESKTVLYVSAICSKE